MSPLRRCSALFRSHASHACAGGRHLLRLSMCARRFAPNAHASLRICLPAHTARTLYVVTPPDAPQPVDISSVSLCRYEHCVLFPSQLAPEHISLRRCSALFSLLRKHAPFQHSSESSLRVAQKGFLQLRSSSAKLFLSPAPGGSHSFAPSGAREDPVRRTAFCRNMLSYARDSSA